MNAGCDQNIALFYVVMRVVLSNGEDVDPVACQGLAERRALANVPQVRVAFDLEEEVFQVAVCVGIAIGKVNLVLIMRKHIVPGKSIEWFVVSTASTVAILVVLDILTAAMPAQVLQLALLPGVNDDLHAQLVQVVDLVLVEDFELYPVLLEGIGNLEEEPLRVAIGVDVVLKQQIVLPFAHL